MTEEVVSDHISVLGEGPVWDEANERIFWLDIINGNIHQYYVNTKKYDAFNAGEMIGCIVPREQGGFIAGLENATPKGFPRACD